MSTIFVFVVTWVISMALATWAMGGVDAMNGVWFGVGLGALIPAAFTALSWAANPHRGEGQLEMPVDLPVRKSPLLRK